MFGRPFVSGPLVEMTLWSLLDTDVESKEWDALLPILYFI